MKTISKRFLKASLAMLLVVIMLFSSTITGFAAYVDNAQTRAATCYFKSYLFGDNYGNNDYPMTYSNGKYTIDITIASDKANKTWNTQILYGNQSHGSSGSLPNDDGYITLVANNGTFSWTPKSAGTYTFTFDASDKKLYVTGGSGDVGGDEEDDVYETSFPATYDSE